MVNVAKLAAWVLIAAALLLAFFAWTLSRRAPAPAHRIEPAATASYPVVVAARRLSAGQPISADALRVARLPVQVTSAFTETPSLAGRVPLVDIEQGTPVLEGQLSSGLADAVKPGERAVAVRIDEAGSVGERIMPGNLVDVFFTLKRDGGGIEGRAEITRSQARLLLSRVRVLAFGDAARSRGDSDQRAVHAHTAVLAVPTADVDRLALADRAGNLLLALRNPSDADLAEAQTSAPCEAVPAMQGGSSRGHCAPSSPSSPSSPSTAAKAGISLSALANSDGLRVAAQSRRADRDAPAGRIEVIRGGRAEALAN
jgi:pilus assembly protein CpaB